MICELSVAAFTLQLTLEQHGSIYLWIFFFNKYMGKFFGDSWQFEKLADEPCSLEIWKKLRKC